MAQYSSAGARAGEMAGFNPGKHAIDFGQNPRGVVEIVKDGLKGLAELINNPNASRDDYNRYLQQMKIEGLQDDAKAQRNARALLKTVEHNEKQKNNLNKQAEQAKQAKMKAMADRYNIPRSMAK